MKPCPWLLLTGFLAGSFTLATIVQSGPLGTAQGTRGGIAQALLGESRTVLAGQMFTEADVYFHSGYYPSFLDQTYAPTNTRHLAPAEDLAEPHATGHSAAPSEEDHEKAMNFLAPPKDWIEAFGRRFAITEHTHLSAGREREILPWLRLSADLDPEQVETYIVAAYWLRRDAGKVREAEQFLREGLAANPDSYEIRFELGRLYEENLHDPVRARNNWRAALRCWLETQSSQPHPDLLGLGQIAVRLARAEEKAGNDEQAIELLRMVLARNASPHPEALRERLSALQMQVSARHR